VLSKDKEIKCEILGRISLVVGDLVEIEPLNDGGIYQGRVTKRLKRLTALYKSKEKIRKPIAANISNIGILVTKNPKTSLEFIDKWITIAINASLEPFLVFNKIDALKEDTYAQDNKIYTNIGIKTFEVSAKKLININNLSEYLLNKTTIFVGNSGSGKSTLTSALTEKVILSRELSNNQGVHTTSVSTLYNFNGMQIIDSPGVRDIGLEHLGSEEIILGFSEINAFSRMCNFPNCSHQKDIGCAVIDAVKNGDISESRYNNFMNLSNGKENG
jgi:ribosome biogenesis GTPase